MVFSLVNRFLSTLYLNCRSFSNSSWRYNVKGSSPPDFNILVQEPPRNPNRVASVPYWNTKTRWIDRANTNLRTQQAQLRYLYSKSAWKLLELNVQHRFLLPGMSVVDLGFAPGAWSTVAAKAVGKSGRVLGVDIIPATSISSINSIQGNFYDRKTQERIIRFMSDPKRGRQRVHSQIDQESYLEMERHSSVDDYKHDERTKMIDVVLSDMLEPFPQLDGLYRRSMNYPYYQVKARPELQVLTHENSIDLCDEALLFCAEALKPGGSFVCKFYSGEEDSALEMKMKKLFQSVKKEKTSLPNNTQDCYFIGLKKRATVQRKDIDV